MELAGEEDLEGRAEAPEASATDTVAQVEEPDTAEDTPEDTAEGDEPEGDDPEGDDPEDESEKGE